MTASSNQATRERPIPLVGSMVRAILDGRKTQTRRVMASDVCPLSAIPYDTPGVIMLGLNGRPVREWFTVSDETSARLWWARPGVGERKPTAAELDRGRKWTQDAIQQHGSCRWTSDELAGLCPFGVPGDQLWVRERARVLGYSTGPIADGVVGTLARLRYEADGADACVPYPSRLRTVAEGRCIPNGVHREGARIHLMIESVRVERLHDISEEDARAEGVEPCGGFMATAGCWTNYGSDGPSCETARDSFRTLWESICGAESWNANPWVWVVAFRTVSQ